MKKTLFTLIIFSSTLLYFIMMTQALANDDNYWYSSRQMAVVVTPSWDATQGRLQLYEKTAVSSGWVKVGHGFPVVLGKKGLKWAEGQLVLTGDVANSAVKREGDNASPAGRFWLTSAFGYDERQLAIPYRRSSSSLKCVDDSQSDHYNRLVDEKQVIKDWGSSEEMLREDALYKIGILVAHNAENKPAQGSCIFLHIWRSPTSGTAGCTAMAEENIHWLAETLDMAKKPMLVQLPQNQYQRLRSHWKLP